jgi:hypothetical protein
MCKYVDIVIDALILRVNYLVNTTSWSMFISDYGWIFYACGLPNVCGAIDGSHISFPKSWINKLL